jgi:hypothetical protein
MSVCGVQEDAKVVELVRLHGAKKWSLIADNLPGRIGKQCRERWAHAPVFDWFTGRALCLHVPRAAGTTI